MAVYIPNLVEVKDKQDHKLHVHTMQQFGTIVGISSHRTLLQEAGTQKSKMILSCQCLKKKSANWAGGLTPEHLLYFIFPCSCWRGHQTSLTVVSLKGRLPKKLQSKSTLSCEIFQIRGLFRHGFIKKPKSKFNRNRK